VVPEVTARGRDRRINLEAPTPNLAPHVYDRVVLDHRNALGHSGIPAHRDSVTARLVAEVPPGMETVLTEQAFRASVRVDKQAITAAARVPAVPSVDDDVPIELENDLIRIRGPGLIQLEGVNRRAVRRIVARVDADVIVNR